MDGLLPNASTTEDGVKEIVTTPPLDEATVIITRDHGVVVSVTATHSVTLRAFDHRGGSDVIVSVGGTVSTTTDTTSSGGGAVWTLPAPSTARTV